MRGKLKRQAVFKLDSRITPADAGKTRSTSPRMGFCWDHPRGCGENTLIVLLKPLTVGSPPRMRGKQGEGRYQPSLTRITPADAGKTLRTTIICSDVKDHPRGCGENAFGLSQALSLSGSPPRMRGKRDIYTDAMALNRITPADAGKTECPVSAV